MPPVWAGAVSETDLSRKIQVALESLGCLVVRVNSGQLRGAGGHVVKLAPVGTPDLYVIAPRFPSRPGYWAGWLEVKAPGGVLSSHQQAWHDMARSRDVRVEVVRSVEGALRIVTGRAA